MDRGYRTVTRDTIVQHEVGLTRDSIPKTGIDPSRCHSCANSEASVPSRFQSLNDP